MLQDPIKVITQGNPIDCLDDVEGDPRFDLPSDSYTPSSPAELRKQEREERRRQQDTNMLELLKTSSRVEAFHGTDDYLADRFGLRGKSTVGRILKRLKQSKKIISDVHRTEENGQWRCWRKIYLVSRASAEVGAIQLCLLVMELGLVEGTSQEVVKLCGRLQCTPQQMSTWAEVAEKKGWLELTREPWRLAVPPHQRTAVWDARDRLGVRLPNRRAKETRDSNGKLIASASTWRPLPIAAQPTTRELLRAHLRRAVAIDGYTLETTPSSAGQSVGAPPR